MSNLKQTEIDKRDGSYAIVDAGKDDKVYVLVETRNENTQFEKYLSISTHVEYIAALWALRAASTASYPFSNLKKTEDWKYFI